MISLGYWHVGSWIGNGVTADYEIRVKNGIFSMEKSDCKCQHWGEMLPTKREIGKRYFGNSEFLVGVDADCVTRMLMSFDGKTEDEVREIAGQHIERRELRHTREGIERERWKKLKDRFDGVVIGLEKSVDVYENGFSVRVLFNSALTFHDRKEFVKKNRKDFVRWVIKEISETECIGRKIGDIGFYKPVEVVVLRAAEAEIKFEIKRSIA